MHWAEKYIGREYHKGRFDCADLVTEVLQNEFNKIISLPSHANGIRAQSQQIHDLQGDFARLTNEPADGDAVLMYCRGCLGHIGVFAKVKGVQYVLHNMQNVGHVVLHRIIDLSQHGLEFAGVYKWK